MIQQYTERDHQITYIPGLFYRAVGPAGGHTRLFGKPGRGVMIYKYNRGSHYGWSDTQAWIIPGIAALCFNDTRGGALRHVLTAGWSVRWLQFGIKKICAGFQMTLRGPNTHIS